MTPEEGQEYLMETVPLPRKGETAQCTLCSSEPSSGFYTGCMVRDGWASEWECDGEGNLTRKVK